MIFISSVLFGKLTCLCIYIAKVEEKMAEASLPIDNRVLVALTNKVKRNSFFFILSSDDS